MTTSSARPILERLAYVCYLMLLVSSIGITWLGWMVGFETGDYTAMCIALGGLALSRWLHVHGYAHWHFRECEDSFEVTGTPGLMPETEQEESLAAQVADLFERLEREEDVWARGELRREIIAKLATSPALRDDFAESLAAHPEI